MRGGEWQRHMFKELGASMALDAQESVRLADCHNQYTHWQQRTNTSMSESTTIDAPDSDGHRWMIIDGLASGIIISVQYSLPTRLQYGENLDAGVEHMPSIAGLEILRLARRVKELEEQLADMESHL